ncbi:MAG: RagB/SusD family nutrient uptake outer membrane protein [Bacteroidaceae bacterium]|nr:RagB/SusD family nutrient uptake outer membrane protein [Bacteroidaceae bacterium]
MKTKLIYLTMAFAVMLGFSSCNLDTFPSDELNSSVLMSQASGAQAIVDGCYAMLKEEYAYVDPYPSGNTYVRHYFQMAEFPADNTCLSGHTTDQLYEATCYRMTANMKNNSHLWWIAYKVIYNANSLIEGFKEGQSAQCDQLIGEAYFLRALMHLNMVTLFAKPYVLGTDNMGVPLRISTNTDETKRATVGEVYDQIVKDLRKAAELMQSPRGNAGYASKNAALGLLSRVYLYMEKNQEVIDVIAEMGDPVAKLDADYPTYFANALSRPETLFAVAHTALESRGQSSIGSMFLNDGIGWGEIYASAPLLNLYERYPEDKRLSYTSLLEETDPKIKFTGKQCVFFPVKSNKGEDFRSLIYDEVKKDDEGLYFEKENKTYRIKEVKVNGMNQPDAAGEYTLYYVTYDGEECNARIMTFPVLRFSFPNVYITKFSYQDGDPMLSSPVFLRYGEIVLNRAEAYAKLGKNAEALADVDAIRKRAGISAEGMFTGNMHGYDNVLDIVLDERRMELAFEGHRMFDVYRNKRDMNRQFPGVQAWEIVKYTDNRIQYPIPYGEVSVSGIPQNPGY